MVKAFIQIKKIAVLVSVFGIVPLFAMENMLVVHGEELVAKERKFADEVGRSRNQKYNIDHKEQINNFPLYSNKKQNLVVIRGTANCGKSSLCRALSALDNSYIIVSQDDINRKVTYEIYEATFPAQMATIRKAIKYENMWRAIQYFDASFTQEVTEHEKQSVMDAITCIRTFFKNSEQEKQAMAMRTMPKYSVLQQLLFNAACGHSIILDSWGATNWDYELEQLKKCFGCTIKVAAYCSLATVLKRWNKRNKHAAKTGNLSEKRTLCQMLTSFFGFLEPAKTDHNSSVIVTKKEFDVLMHNAPRYIHDLNDESPKGAFSHNEFTVEDLLAFKEKMYTKFGFDSADQVALVPSIAHDILLCTEGECNNYARELLEKISEK